MGTYTFHHNAQTNEINCTDPNSREVPLSEVPAWAMRDVLAHLDGLLTNGRWHASV